MCVLSSSQDIRHVFSPPFVDRIVSNSLFLLPSQIQPHSSGASSGGHPGSSDQALPGHEQRGLPVHISKSLQPSSVCVCSQCVCSQHTHTHRANLSCSPWCLTSFLTSQSLRAYKEYCFLPSSLLLSGTATYLFAVQSQCYIMITVHVEY